MSPRRGNKAKGTASSLWSMYIVSSEPSYYPAYSGTDDEEFGDVVRLRYIGCGHEVPFKYLVQLITSVLLFALDSMSNYGPSSNI
jgi:hypothetical protein